MKHLKLSCEPVFPLEIKRRKKCRDEWARLGLITFKALWPRGSAVCKMTESATIKGTLLRINAVIIYPTAEVWDGQNNLCRIWFKVGENGYEASKLNGWKAVPCVPLVSGVRCSKEAMEKAGQVANTLTL